MTRCIKALAVACAVGATVASAAFPFALGHYVVSANTTGFATHLGARASRPSPAHGRRTPGTGETPALPVAPSDKLRTLSGTTSAVIARIEKGTEAIRGLHATRPVPVTLLAPDAFRRLVERDFERDTSASAIRDMYQPLALLGLLPMGTDLRRVLRDAEGSGVAAFYDEGAKRFYIPLRAGGLSLDDQVTISHEYTHALQDQTFDLSKVRPDPAQQTLHDSDRQLAETALIEGDATVEMTLYAQDTFSQAQYIEYQREAQQAANGVGAQTPPFLLDGQLFPYNAGSIFETRLLGHTFAGVDFSGVNSAFRHPPVSTREILHPEVYQANPTAPAPDLPVPAPALSNGWRRVDSDVFGEFQLQDMLAQRLDPGVAAQAADIWRADRYALFDRGADFLLAWRLRAASPAAARTLAQALVAYMDARYHAALSLSSATLTYAAPDSALALRRVGSDLYVALGSRGALRPAVAQALATM